MIRHKLGRAVQWTEGDAHMVGREVTYHYLRTSGDMVLVALSHTRELVSVRESELSDYPSEPIEEPTKRPDDQIEKTRLIFEQWQRDRGMSYDDLARIASSPNASQVGRYYRSDIHEMWLAWRESQRLCMSSEEPTKMTIEDIANELRALESDHSPDGFPAVKMATITKLLAFVEEIYYLNALSKGRCVCRDLRRECERNYD